MFPVEPIPERIGAYRVLRRLSAPGPAETFLGRVEGPRGFARECVLKRMKNTTEGNERLTEELSREAAICAKLNHPAILRMIDFFEDGGQLVLALEHIDGTSLDKLQEHLAEGRQKLGDAAAFYIGHRVAGALAHAHAAVDEQSAPTPIIHRNLHPSNVIIGVDGDVRLTGFGVGKILGRTPDTAIGTIKGTPGYMAPEQARGEPVTAKADTYGLGLLLWSLLTGRKPPSDGTWPAKIGSLRQDLPREIAALIDAALDRFPGTRRITCGEIERWLGKVGSDDKGRRELKEQMRAIPEGGVDDPATEPAPAAMPRGVPTVPAAPGNPFQGVRFGAPAVTDVKIAAVPPPPPLTPAKAGGDWRKSLPDADNIDDFIDSVRSVDRGRQSEATIARPRAFPPAPPLPSAPGLAPVAAPPSSTATPMIPPPPAATPKPPPAPAARPLPTPPPTPAPPVSAPIAAPVVAPIVTPTAAPVAAPIAAPVVAPVVAPIAAPLSAPRFAPLEPPPPTPPLDIGIKVAPVFGKPPEAAVKSAPVFGAPPVFSPGPPPVGPVSSRALPEPPPKPRAPSPSRFAISRRTLGTAGTIAVSALTATIVVVVAFLFREHPPAPAPASSAEAASPSPSSSSVPVVAAPPATVTATPTAAPSPSPSPSTAPAAPSVDKLPSGFGYLTVVSPSTAHVYLSGKHLGPVNEPLQARCGRWFVRLATPREGRYPEWVSRGETIDIACQATTKIDIAPTPKGR